MASKVEEEQKRTLRSSRFNCNTASNLVQIPLATGSDPSSSFGVELNNVHCLQLLEDVTGNTTTAFAKVRWATTVPLASTIDSTESTNTKSSPQVNLPCHRCSSDVVPIRIIWCKLLQLSGLHNVCPCGKLDLKQTIMVSENQNNCKKWSLTFKLL